MLPFGFGLSYSSFKYDLVPPPQPSASPPGPLPPPPPVSLERLAAALHATTDAGRTFPSQASLAPVSNPPMASFTVHVTNEGAVDSDEVVLGFLVPPGAGSDGTPLQYLFGFERVHVPAGASVTVTLTPSPMDFAAVGATGKYEPRPGRYVARFGVEATVAHGGAYVESAPFEAVLPPSQPHSPPSAVAPASKPFTLAGRALYFLLIDRFARSGAEAANTTGCGGSGWCGGTLRGVLDHLDYIQGMGFECVWVSPVVEQPKGECGASGTGYHGCAA